jgi:hypothetical protein
MAAALNTALECTAYSAGAIPSWVEERLAGRSTAELEDLSVRVLDAQSIEDLLR